MRLVLLITLLLSWSSQGFATEPGKVQIAKPTKLNKRQKRAAISMLMNVSVIIRADQDKDFIAQIEPNLLQVKKVALPSMRHSEELRSAISDAMKLVAPTTVKKLQDIRRHYVKELLGTPKADSQAFFERKDILAVVKKINRVSQTLPRLTHALSIQSLAQWIFLYHSAAPSLREELEQLFKDVKSIDPSLAQHRRQIQYKEEMALAARFGDLSTMQRLADAGFRPDKLEPTVQGALVDAAISSGQINALRFLMKLNVDPDHPEYVKLQGSSPLHNAVTKSADATRILLKNEADPNVRDHLGRSPLALAIQGGNRDAIAALLEFGADPNIPDAEGVTPLAREADKPDVRNYLDLLLEAGADVDSQDQFGYPTMIKLVMSAPSDQYMRAILKSRNIDARNKGGATPLVTAVFFKRHDIVKILAKAGADPNVMNAAGYTPLHLAIEAGDLQMVRTLVQDCGADPRKHSGAGLAPLKAAELHRKPEIVAFLKTVL